MGSRFFIASALFLWSTSALAGPESWGAMYEVMELLESFGIGGALAVETVWIPGTTGKGTVAFSGSRDRVADVLGKTREGVSLASALRGAGFTVDGGGASIPYGRVGSACAHQRAMFNLLDTQKLQPGAIIQRSEHWFGLKENPFPDRTAGFLRSASLPKWGGPMVHCEKCTGAPIVWGDDTEGGNFIFRPRLAPGAAARIFTGASPTATASGSAWRGQVRGAGSGFVRGGGPLLVLEAASRTEVGAQAINEGFHVAYNGLDVISFVATFGGATTSESAATHGQEFSFWKSFYYGWSDNFASIRGETDPKAYYLPSNRPKPAPAKAVSNWRAARIVLRKSDGLPQYGKLVMRPDGVISYYYSDEQLEGGVVELP